MGYENKDPKKPPHRLVNIHGIREVTGGSLPAIIWKRFMLEATRNLAPLPFPQPTLSGIVLNSTTTPAPTSTFSIPTTTLSQGPGSTSQGIQGNQLGSSDPNDTG